MELIAIIAIHCNSLSVKLQDLHTYDILISDRTIPTFVLWLELDFITIVEHIPYPWPVLWLRQLH